MGWWGTHRTWLPEGLEGPGQLPKRLWSLEVKWDLAAHASVCVHVCLCACTGSNGEILDTRPATGWSGCLSPVTGRIHCVCACAHTVRRSVPAAGAGLRPQELVQPDASSWGVQRQAVTGWSVCLCPASKGIHILQYFPLTGLHCDHSERGRGWCQRCCLCCSVWPVTGMCVLYMCACVCASQEHVLSSTTGSSWGHKAVAALPLSGYWIWQCLNIQK